MDWFYNGKTQRAERGLEVSVVAIVDIEQNTGYPLSAQQTEANLSETAKDKASKGNRSDFYLGHLADCVSYFPDAVRYVAADGFYSKYKWVNGVVSLGYDSIGKLRTDANLKFLYDGPYSGRGRPQCYDGKVNLKDTTHFKFVKPLEDGVNLYTAVVWSVNLKRKVRLAYLQKQQEARSSYVVLFSTDIDIDPVLLYRCYKARFQIEFIFRDARQYTGLADFQARGAQAIDTHVNASLLALNLVKAAIKPHQNYQNLLDYGTIAT